MASATTLYDFRPKDSEFTSDDEDYAYPIEKGATYDLGQWRDKVVLVVNTASKCGFTPQFEGLEKLYKKVTSDESCKNDFVILGFPCNQFGGQDPGDNDTIQAFCLSNFGVSFPVLGKTEVNGGNAEPLFEWLKSEQPGILGMKRVKWNFEKWLVGRDGKCKARWASTTKPETLESPIMEQLRR